MSGDLAGIDALLPTLERARAAGPLMVERKWYQRDLNLWDCNQVRVESLAGIVMRGRLLRIESWERREDLSPRRFQALSEAGAQEQKEFAPRRYARVKSHGQIGQCSHCVPTFAGRMACIRCGGTALLRAVRDDGNLVPCPACDEGFVPCTHCEGSNRTLDAVVEYLEQRIEAWSSLVLPDVPPRVSQWLYDQSDPSSEQPEALRFPLDRMIDEGPYRGTSGAREPDFRGYRFLGSFGRAREALGEIANRHSVVSSECQSYALPILWIEFDARGAQFDGVFVVDREGALQRFAAARV